MIWYTGRMIQRCANSECSKIFIPQGRNRATQIYCCIKCRNKVHYRNNREYYKEYYKEHWKEYYNTHPITRTRADNIRGQSNRRARKRNAGGTYTEIEYIAKGEAYGWKCRYCGIQLSYATAIREHSIPLARGGDNAIANIFPSCQKCNNEKHTMTGIEYMVYRMRRKYLARRK
jgi:5-methylcytosine-specific restriction endonuclease McrA